MQASNDELPPKNGDRLAWGNGGTIIRPPTSKVNIVKNTTKFQFDRPARNRVLSVHHFPA